MFIEQASQGRGELQAYLCRKERKIMFGSAAGSQNQCLLKRLSTVTSEDIGTSL